MPTLEELAAQKKKLAAEKATLQVRLMRTELSRRRMQEIRETERQLDSFARS